MKMSVKSQNIGSKGEITTWQTCITSDWLKKKEQIFTGNPYGPWDFPMTVVQTIPVMAPSGPSSCVWCLWWPLVGAIAPAPGQKGASTCRCSSRFNSENHVVVPYFFGETTVWHLSKSSTCISAPTLTQIAFQFLPHYIYIYIQFQLRYSYPSISIDFSIVFSQPGLTTLEARQAELRDHGLDFHQQVFECRFTRPRNGP